jgi:hypothetical protein
MDLKDSQYQTGIKLLQGVETAVQQAMGSMRRKEERSTLRRRIEEIDMLLKKVKREIGVA